MLFVCLLIAVPMGAIVGWLTDRFETSVSQAMFPRKRWTYLMRSGRRVNALGPWRYPLVAASWRLGGCAMILLCAVIFHKHVVFRTTQYRDPSFLRGELVPAWQPRPDAGPEADGPVGRRLFTQIEESADRLSSVVPTRRASGPGRAVASADLDIADPDAENPGRGTCRNSARFGPFVAIGRPGEEVSEIGAARMYVEDDDWEVVVSDLLNRPVHWPSFRQVKRRGCAGSWPGSAAI